MTKVLLELAVFLGGLLSLLFLGRRQEKQKQKIKDLEAKTGTLERINNVETNTTVDASLDRLRKQGHVRD